MDSDNSRNNCRICLEPVNNDNRYCDCDGSLAHVHDKCLLEWLIYSKKINCELCNRDITVRNKLSKTKIFVLFLLFISYIAFVFISITLSFHVNDLILRYLIISFSFLLLTSLFLYLFIFLIKFMDGIRGRIVIIPINN